MGGSRFIAEQNMPFELVLVRHGESEWNKAGLFTGWYDCDLSDAGREEAKAAGKALKEAGYTFDLAYTSVLKRAIKTLWGVLSEMDLCWIPVIHSWRLNERMYGGLTGLDKKATVDKHGIEQVLIWRRSYDVPPPEVDVTSEYFPGSDPRYAHLDQSEIPRTECLKDTVQRCLPFWESEIAPAILSGKRVLIAAHGNSIRAICKHLDNISENDIPSLEIPTGIPLVYTLDDGLRPIRNEDSGILSAKFIGDPEAVRLAQEKVANQVKK
eukprot:c38999_g1_i1.p2 GENE.c38999_g1_i1~~c38999_g1_i1.p2  ORF type:complete len:268 (+),score=56.66 c38999_g1_i1:1-804(+)